MSSLAVIILAAIMVAIVYRKKHLNNKHLAAPSNSAEELPTR